MYKESFFACGEDWEVYSGNSDANCHRIRPSYVRRQVTKSCSQVCAGCIYNETAVDLHGTYGINIAKEKDKIVAYLRDRIKGKVKSKDDTYYKLLDAVAGDRIETYERVNKFVDMDDILASITVRIYFMSESDLVNLIRVREPNREL